MPPLQHPSTLDPAAVIPFSDHASPFDNLFNSDLTTHQPQPLSFAPSYQQQPQHQVQHQAQYPAQLQQQQKQPAHSHNNSNNDTIPSEADISALFGLTPSQALVPVHTSDAVSTPAPRQLTTSPSPPRPSMPSTLAPLAPAAHYSSSPQHNHHSQEKSLISPIPISPTVYNGSAPPALTSYTPTPSNAYNTIPTTNAVATKRVAHHRYLSYDTTTYDQTAQQAYTAEPQEQHQYYPGSAPYQQYNANTDYSQHGYSYTIDDTSSKKSRAAPTDPLMLHAPSRSIFSRFGGGGGTTSGLSTETQSAFAPKFKVAASYVSSTLAVTSTFASEKLATASTKIADLWQHNQHSLPQQQPQPHYQQQQQNDALYNHGQYYGTPPEAPSTINSDHFNSSQTDMQQQQQVQYSYEGQGLSTNPTFNSNYQSSYNNNNNNNNNNNMPSGLRGYNNNNNNNYNSNNTNDYSTRNPFASTASSTLSNAASVAGSYLPSLSKLPALPALSALPALRGLPALPWVSRDKNQQLPQQQTLPDQQQYHQYSVDQKQSSDAYYGSYAPSQDSVYQQPQDQQQQQQHQQQHQKGYGYQYNAADWWGGIRNEVQKGRRMVQTGVQVGVAWWWDSSEKNPLGGVV